MSRKAKLNFSLLIIILCLSCIAWYQPGLNKMVISYLSTLKNDEIHTIVIERQNMETIKLNKHNNHWLMDEPYRMPANVLRVDTITALAEKRSYSQFLIKDSERVRYKLDTPLLSVYINEQKIILGSTHPIKEQRYAMNLYADSNTVHLINGIIYYQLRAALNNFISPLLLPPYAKLIGIRWSDKILTLKEGQWHLIADNNKSVPTESVSTESAAQLIQFWHSARASKVETNRDTINDEQLKQNSRIIISYTQTIDHNSTISEKISEQEHKEIHYVVIQDGSQLKLLRTDNHIAYSVTPQSLQQLTEFMPVKDK